MKKTLSVIMCALLLTLALLVPAAARERASFVVLGDSIAQGVGADDMAVDSYAALVAKECGYELTNRAKAGDTSKAMLLKVKHNAAIREAIRGADIIEISIGGNDFLLGNMAKVVREASAGNLEPVERILVTFRKNFADIIGEIRSLNPDALVIVETLYNPISNDPDMHKVFESALNLLNACYYDYLADNPGSYVVADVHGAFAGKQGLIFKDNIHPSSAGHRVIADTVEEVLKARNAVADIPQTGSAASFAVLALAASLVGAAAARRRKDDEH